MKVLREQLARFITKPRASMRKERSLAVGSIVGLLGEPRDRLALFTVDLEPVRKRALHFHALDLRQPLSAVRPPRIHA